MENWKLLISSSDCQTDKTMPHVTQKQKIKETYTALWLLTDFCALPLLHPRLRPPSCMLKNWSKSVNFLDILVMHTTDAARTGSHKYTLAVWPGSPILKLYLAYMMAVGCISMFTVLSTVCLEYISRSHKLVRVFIFLKSQSCFM